MTSFRPASGDHGTDMVIFQLIFDAPLGPDIFAAAEAQHVKWREELPALQLGNPDPVRLPGFLALPPQTAGVSFSHLRPDGLPAWQVRFDPGSISVVCTRYIRWERIWKTAKRYLEKALELIAAEDGERAMSIAMLQFADRFETPAAGYDAKSLLKTGPHLPAAAFTLGPAWHNNMGWFDKDHALGEVLHNLNIASNPLPLPDTATNEETVSIGITHIQELRLAPALALGDAKTVSERLDQAMNGLHGANRALVKELLVGKVPPGKG